MRAMTYDLERKYHDDKRVYVSPSFSPPLLVLTHESHRLQEANSALQEENSRLRQQIDASRSSAVPASSSLPGGAPSSSTSTLGRPTLPPIMAGGHGTPARPGSSGPPGFEREGATGYPGGAAPYTNGRERDGSVAHEHPSKRLRTEEEERRKSAFIFLFSPSLVSSSSFSILQVPPPVNAHTLPLPIPSLALLRPDLQPRINKLSNRQSCISLRRSLPPPFPLSPRVSAALLRPLLLPPPPSLQPLPELPLPPLPPPRLLLSSRRRSPSRSRASTRKRRRRT